MAIDGSYRENPYQQESALRTLAKYFLHGLLYSLLMIGVALVWAVLFIFLVVIGSIIGLVLGFLIFFIGIGWANKIIAGLIWDINSKGGWSLLGHGFVLLLGLFIVQSPWMFIDVFFTHSSLQVYAVYAIVQILVMAIVDGILGKKVASMFEEEGVTKSPLPKPRQSLQSLQRLPSAQQVKSFCPNCGVPFPYKDTDISPDGTAVCRQCGAVLHDPRYPRGNASDTRKDRSFP
jgi:glucan phosphoethanolaminetransferase (alkaline phosphatase superfamily)